MPLFQYTAMNASGQEIKADVEASSSDDAIAKIRAKGLWPSKVSEKAVKKAKKEKKADAASADGEPKKKGDFQIRIPGFDGVSQAKLVQFTRQLSTLQDAGLPILRSLKVLTQQQKPGKLKDVLDEVASDVESGQTLSISMAKHPKAFDKLYANMIQAGEASGALDVILQRLADFMEKAQRLKRKVIGAMVYPICVVSASAAIVTGIMIFVIPKFKVIFADFKTDMPLPTQMLIDFSDWLVGGSPLPGWVWIIAFPFMLVATLKGIRATKRGGELLDRVSLKIPIFGQILRKTTVARFTRTLGTLIGAGVPILEAITITKDTCGNIVFANALSKVHDSIREGEGFANPLRATKVVDSLVVNMIDVGEETGDMDKMLMKIADNYDEEVDVLVDSLVSLLEPIMVLMLGGIVGTIVICLFLPMVKLLQSIGGG